LGGDDPDRHARALSSDRGDGSAKGHSGVGSRRGEDVLRAAGVPHRLTATRGSYIPNHFSCKSGRTPIYGIATCCATLGGSNIISRKHANSPVSGDGGKYAASAEELSMRNVFLGSLAAL